LASGLALRIDLARGTTARPSRGSRALGKKNREREREREGEGETSIWFRKIRALTRLPLNDARTHRDPRFTAPTNVLRTFRKPGACFASRGVAEEFERARGGSSLIESLRKGTRAGGLVNRLIFAVA
jgi:hypothetical protein